MSSAESRLNPGHKIQLNHGAGVVQPADSESKQGPNTSTASRAESLLAAEKRTLEMIADGASLTDILDHVCTSIDAQISPSIATILLMDADGQKLWPSAGPRVPQDWARAITPLPVAPDTGLCGTASFLKTRVIVPDVATEPIWREEYRQAALKNGIRAAWSQPILTKDNQVLGTFAIYSSEARMPMREDLALVEAAGHIALIAIERHRSQAALALALENIKTNEESLRLIVDTIPGQIAVMTAGGEVELLNRQILEYFCKTTEELKNWVTNNTFHVDDLPRTISAWKRAEGELEKAFEKIAKSEAELRTIIDAIPQLIVALGADGDFLSANQALLEYTGLKKEELGSEKFRAVFHPEDSERLRDQRAAALSRGVPFEYERRVRRRDGQVSIVGS